MDIPDVTKDDKPNPIEESYIPKNNNSNKNTLINKDNIYPKESNTLVIYIPGTCSSKDRWEPYPEIIDGYNNLFSHYGVGDSDNKNIITNYFFDWETNSKEGISNGLFNGDF
ncbi:MAG: hypothetical protein R3Y22_06095 [Bacteroidales bacterium]